MPSASRRVNRINVSNIDITFRGDISLTTLDVWREDRLVSGESTYLVLDFGMEERVENMDADKDEDDQEWRPSGRAMVEIQNIDPVTGEGQSLPTFKEIAGDEGAVSAWVGWELVPCSPRRPAAEQDSEAIDINSVDAAPGAVCLMCGSADVAYVETDGTARCSSHVGEAPELDPTDG